MRVFILILMVALLPLRLWAAEGMAVSMAVEQAQAAPGLSVTKSMPRDCPMMAKADAQEDEPGSQALGHCMACHLCAASACLPEAAAAQGTAPTGPLVASAPRYASADSPRDLRPPIS